jgi:diguanylate cyclase (GGDEF)-like protein/PAS domain S-box-containing protein
LFDVYQCIWRDHDVRLVVLAGLICVVAAIAIVLFLREARDARDGARTRWLVASGVVSGFAVWATHFTAMMGYDPGVIVGYAIVPSLLSLAIAIGATTLGFGIALRVPTLWARILAGMITAGGASAMHYLGMQALQIDADFRWSPGMVAASILLAILPAPIAISLAIDGRSRASGVAAAALIVLGVLVLHFTGMTGLTLLPGPGEHPDELLLSSPQMGLAVAIVALSLLTLSILAVLLHTRLRAAVDASEREFKILVEGITDCAIYMLSSDGHVASWNAGAERLKGYTRDEAIGLELATFYSPEDRAAGVPERGIETARRQGKFNAEGWRYRKDGSRFWAHVTIESVYDETGAFHGFAKITRDMTLFMEHQRNLDAALSNMHQGLCLFGPDRRLIISNDRVGAIFGVSYTECPPGTLFEDVFRIALQKHLGDAFTPEVVEEAVARHRAVIANPGGGTLIVPFSAEVTLSVTHRPTAEGGWVTTFDDITERRQAQERIEHMALHDALTGLPNRANYTERLDVALAAAARTGGHVAVIGVDLDRFKEVNDLHGHAAGDAVLRLLADRLNDVLEDGEVVARFGGDEFAAFKPLADQADVSDFVSRLESCLTTPAVIDDLTVHLGASLGIALFPADGRTREQIINNADLAMYRAKTTVGRHICYYEHGMDEAARVRRTIANDLREAIARNELSPVYQIQKTVPTEEAVGFEALLRWQHPRDGWISPRTSSPSPRKAGRSCGWANGCCARPVPRRRAGPSRCAWR